MPTFSIATLTDFSTKLLQAAGTTADEAKVVAESLVDANSKGYDSHGVMRLPYYVQAMRDKEMISGVALSIESEGPSRLVTDANWGLGQVQAQTMLSLLIEKAVTSGLAIGTTIHSGHIGRLGEYCERAAACGMVSLIMVNSHGGVVRVAPPGGKAPRLSTNPLAIGVPNGDKPLVLDFSTSATAEGKVRVAKIAGKPVPEGWLLNSDGVPTTNPEDLYAKPPGSILPMGGTQSYKGFGLGLMIEIFAGAISGGVTARPIPYPNKGNCVFWMLVNPSAFGGANHFAAEVAQLTEYVRSSPVIVPGTSIVLPGDPERNLAVKRTSEGITLDNENWQALVKLAQDLGVSAPQA